MSEELKPCPFCGGSAKLLGGPMAQETYSVWCENRHHQDYGFSKDEAITAWNTRSDLALAAQGALLEKIASWHDELANHDQSGLVYSSLVGIPISNADELDLSVRTHEWCATETRSLSPDATAALAEHTAKVRNDALREALEKITSNYPKNADTDYDKGLDYGLTSAAVIIEALITTEEKNDD